MITVKSYKPSQTALVVEIVIPWVEMPGIEIRATCAAQVRHSEADGWNTYCHLRYPHLVFEKAALELDPKKPPRFAVTEARLSIPDTDGPIFITPSAGMVLELEIELDNWLCDADYSKVAGFATELEAVEA